MVVPEAARPPAESLDSPYATSLSKKGKKNSVSSIASMKLLMRGVSSRDIFSRAPSRAPSEIGLARTSQGSGSSTLETIHHGASESETETAARDVANPGHARTDSAVVRGLLGDATGKVTGTESGAVAVPVVARLTKEEEERAESIEALLAKRDAGEAPSADEPSSAELRKELVGLEAKRAAASASFAPAGAAVGASAAAPAAISESVSGAPSVASVELDLPRARSHAAGGAPRRASAAVAASPYGSALRSKSKMRRAAGQVAAASAATRAMKPGKKKGAGVSAGAPGAPGHARTDSAVVRELVRDAITTITEHGPETAARGVVGDAIDESAADVRRAAASGSGGGGRSPSAPSAGHARTDSAVIRGLVGDAIDRVSAEGAGSGAPSAPSAAAAAAEAARVAALESILAKRERGGGDAGSGDDEPAATTDALRAELETLRSNAKKRAALGDAAPASGSGSLSDEADGRSGRSGRSLRGAQSASDSALAPASSAKSRFRRAVSAVSMGSLFARAGPPRSSTPRGSARPRADPRGFGRDGSEDPVKRLVQEALRGATEKEADAEASSFGAYGALTAEEETRKKALLSALARLDAPSEGEGASDGATKTVLSAELQAELVLLEAKRVKAAAELGGPAFDRSAGGSSRPSLEKLSLTSQEEDRAAFLERLLAKRDAEGGAPSGARPSAEARRELIALLARRAAAEQAEDERASVLEAMLAERTRNGTATKAKAKAKAPPGEDEENANLAEDDADDDDFVSSARAELRALRERRAARPGTDARAPFDPVSASPSVAGPEKHATNARATRESVSESDARDVVRAARTGETLVAPTPPGPARDASRANPSPRRRHPLGAGAGASTRQSTQRSQFGPMVDSLKRSSPSVGFGSALRFDFQRASAPAPDSERGHALRRSQSRLRGIRGGAGDAGAAAAGDAFASFSVPGPGTYATTKYRAFGPQCDGEKKSFPAVSIGRAGRFAAAERETETTRRWPGPDAYRARSSLGAQPVSRCDTLPRIAFTRARRAVGNANAARSKGSGGSETSDAAFDVPGWQPRGGEVDRTAPGRGAAPGRRFPGAARWRDGDGGAGAGFFAGAGAEFGRLYDSVGDQALSYHPNAPYAHFGSSFRARAGLVSLSKKQAKKAMCGQLGPGPAYPPGPAAVGKQVHSGKANAPAVGFTRRARLSDAGGGDAAEEPGPGSYRV